MKLEIRLLAFVQKMPGTVVLRAELSALGSASRVSDVLKSLQAQGVLIRIGTGIYAKTRISSATGAVVVAGSLESLSVEALEKLGVSVSPSKAASEYNAGKTTQLPGRLVVNTGQRRIRRKIIVGGRQLAYENDIDVSSATR